MDKEQIMEILNEFKYKEERIKNLKDINYWYGFFIGFCTFALIWAIIGLIRLS